jgi:hypothetical protein
MNIGEGNTHTPPPVEHEPGRSRSSAFNSESWSERSKIAELENTQREMDEFLKSIEHSLKKMEEIIKLRETFNELLKEKSLFKVYQKLKGLKKDAEDIRDATLNFRPPDWMVRLEEEFQNLSEAEKIAVGASAAAFGLIGMTVVVGAVVVGGSVSAGGALLASSAAGLATATGVTRVSFDVGMNSTKAFLGQQSELRQRLNGLGSGPMSSLRTAYEVSKSGVGAQITGIRQTAASAAEEKFSKVISVKAIPLP